MASFFVIWNVFEVEEMKGMMGELDDDFIRWLAQYLVMKRVSIEQNFQPLYNLFLMALENKRMVEYVKLETFRNIKVWYGYWNMIFSNYQRGLKVLESVAFTEKVWC